MKQALAIAGGSFQGVAECVAEIEEGALAFLALVAGDDGGVRRAAPRHRVVALRPARDGRAG